MHVCSSWHMEIRRQFGGISSFTVSVPRIEIRYSDAFNRLATLPDPNMIFVTSSIIAPFLLLTVKSGLTIAVGNEQED